LARVRVKWSEMFITTSGCRVVLSSAIRKLSSDWAAKKSACGMRASLFWDFVYL